MRYLGGDYEWGLWVNMGLWDYKRRSVVVARLHADAVSEWGGLWE